MRISDWSSDVCSSDLMIAQIQLLDISDPIRARLLILERRAQIEAICNGCDPTLVGLDGRPDAFAHPVEPFRPPRHARPRALAVRGDRRRRGSRCDATGLSPRGQ